MWAAPTVFCYLMWWDGHWRGASISFRREWISASGLSIWQSSGYLSTHRTSGWRMLGHGSPPDRGFSSIPCWI